MIDKASLRAQARQARASLIEDAVQQFSSDICKQIIELPAFQQASRVACYLPFEQEVDLLPLIQQGWQDGKEIYVPIVIATDTKKMDFYPYTPSSKLHTNHFGINEPLVSHDTKAIDLHELDLLIVPVVAFDRQCNRIGQGAGYYDRYLSHSPDEKPIRLGAAYEIQQVNNIPTDKWDVPLDLVVTEETIYQRRC